MRDQRRWLLALPSCGTVVIDDGALRAMFKKKSLLAAGITKVTGDFMANECVTVESSEGYAIGQGLVDLDSADLRKIAGLQSSEFNAALGFEPDPEVIDRNNFVPFDAENHAPPGTPSARHVVVER